VKPEWLATHEIKPGALEAPAYKALWENSSEREKQGARKKALTPAQR
jgi:hypothetical protein